MRKVWLAVLGLAVIGYGCGPQLAQSPYGQKETQWEGYVKKSYPSWAPAKTIPPVEQQGSEVDESTSQNQPAGSSAAPGNTIPEIVSFEKQPEPNLLPLQPLTELPDNDITAPVKAEPKSYTVKKGDTLGGIAKSFYGSATKWRIIRDANKDKISDPNKLKVGTVLTVPAL